MMHLRKLTNENEKNLICQFYRKQKTLYSVKKKGDRAIFISKWISYYSMLYLQDKNKIHKFSERGLNENEEQVFLNRFSQQQQIRCYR